MPRNPNFWDNDRWEKQERNFSRMFWFSFPIAIISSLLFMALMVAGIVWLVRN